MNALRLDPLFDLTGCVAVLTDDHSGSWRAIAEALGAQGARLILTARRTAAPEQACDAFAASGIGAHGLPVDLADRPSLIKAAQAAREPFGPPDILVDAAGNNIRKPFPETEDSDRDATLALSLTAPFLLTRAFALTKEERGWGRIIDIASFQSVLAFNLSGVYGASKAGLALLTRATAEHWSPFGVNGNAIAPGFYPSPLTAAVFSDPARARACRSHDERSQWRAVRPPRRGDLPRFGRERPCHGSDPLHRRRRPCQVKGTRRLPCARITESNQMYLGDRLHWPRP